jgi:SNF2 family DNA or RNA helicase
VRALPAETRLRAADRIRTLKDFALPPLDFFNTAPCKAHTDLEVGCRHCGIRFRKHQRVGIAWLYMRGKGLIADQVGSGKTPIAAGLLALCKQAGELEGGQRAVVVVRPSALGQWADELHRFLPDIPTVTATGSRRQRIDKYLSPWDILVTGYQMLVNDLDLLTNFPAGLLLVDDVDALRNPANRTAYAIKRLARPAPRVAVFTATPLQKKLHELHSILEPIGGMDIFGSRTAFARRYVREELVRVYNERAGRRVLVKQVTGYKNLDEFVTKVRPLTLRRTPDDIDDVDLPVIHPPHNIYLDLYPAQRKRYDELRNGVLRILKTKGAEIKRAAAVAQFNYGQQICDGLATLGEPDGPATSSKLDWIQDTVIDGDLADEKVVIYCHYQNTAAALMARLARAGVGHVVIWGREPDKAARQRAKNRFWDDPGCRVLVGTDAIEQSLNLQASRHLVCVDQILNAARMSQLAGRIRRDGSRYKTVYVHNLLTAGTQEAAYLDVLAREQAVADFVWGERSELYEALSPLMLLQLVGNSRKE